MMVNSLNALSPPVSNALFGTTEAYVNYPIFTAQAARTYTNKSSKKSSNDEKAFQNWIRNTDWFKEFVSEYGEEPDLDTKDYDYRAAWKAGVVPERDPYDRNRFHWPSSLPSGKMLKSEDHPTAWKEYFMRDTGVNPDSLNIKTPEEANIYLKNKR